MTSPKTKDSWWRSLRGSPRMANQYTSTNKNFCLYKKEPNTLDEKREGVEENEVVVSVVATDLDGEKESHLRRYVVHKASKNMVYKSGTINVIPRGNASPNPKGPVFQLVGFIALLELAGEDLDTLQQQTEEESAPTTSSREYYICFLCEVDNDHSLSLFHAELKNFTETLIPILQRHASDQEKLSKSITLTASAWYWTTVDYITRCVTLLDIHLDKVIHAILLGKQVVIAAPQPVFDDLAKLLMVVSIVNLSPQAFRGGDDEDEPVALAASGAVEDTSRLVITCSSVPLTTFIPSPTPIDPSTTTITTTDDNTPSTTTPNIPAPSTSILPPPPSSLSTILARNPSAPYIPRAGDYADVQISLNTKDTNNFCTSWANQLRSGSSDPFRLRTLLEDLKLKVIQELNFIRKVIDQAKLSNYQLYKSYVVLRANSNCDILLNLLMKDITNDVVTTEVLEVIHEHMLEEASEQPVR